MQRFGRKLVVTSEPDELTELKEIWNGGFPLRAGRLIFERVPAKARPAWAGKLLTAVVRRSDIVSPEIERIIALSHTPSEWRAAHDAFSAARRQLLRLNAKEPLLPQEDLLRRLLSLAELTAKVTYNAIEPGDPFDEDAGWCIAPSLRRTLTQLGDCAFAESMWSELTSVEGYEETSP